MLYTKGENSMNAEEQDSIKSALVIVSYIAALPLGEYHTSVKTFTKYHKEITITEVESKELMLKFLTGIPQRPEAHPGD